MASEVRPVRATRRRGAALENAIVEATLAELAEVGYAQLTMERVAERAGAGKASLYRRWPGKVDLVLAAVRARLPGQLQVPDHGNLRDDLVALFRLMAVQLAGPSGEALRGVIAESLAAARRGRSDDSDGAVAERELPATLAELSAGTGVGVVGAIVDRAVARGEVPAERVCPTRVEAGLAMLRHHFLLRGRITDDQLVAVVDEVMVPLLVGDPSPGQPGRTARNASVR